MTLKSYITTVGKALLFSFIIIIIFVAANNIFERDLHIMNTIIVLLFFSLIAPWFQRNTKTADNEETKSRKETVLMYVVFFVLVVVITGLILLFTS